MPARGVRGKAVRRAVARGRAVARDSKGAPVVIPDEQRTALVEDMAYFRAERLRGGEWSHFRKQDRLEAEAEIDALIRRCARD